MSEMIYGLIGAVGTPLVLFLWQLLLKREMVYAWGRRVGAIFRIFLLQRIGVSGGKKLTERFKSTIGDFIEGIYNGLQGNGAKG